MRKKISLILVIASVFISAQTLSNKKKIVSDSISKCKKDEERLIAPWVKSVDSLENVEDGTFVFDMSDQKVKYMRAGKWTDLTVYSTDKINTYSIEQIKNEKPKKENNNKKNNNPKISASEKITVLPKVASPHLSIVDPTPGMMVYDTDSNMLAIFNGKVWTFWKPED